MNPHPTAPNALRQFTPSRRRIRLGFFMLISGIVIAGMTNIAAADSWICERDNETRRIWVDYPQGAAVPCQVLYEKSQRTNTPVVLWSALTTQGYCESKSQHFISQQSGWGWTCRSGRGHADGSQSDDANSQVPETFGTVVNPADTAGALNPDPNL